MNYCIMKHLPVLSRQSQAPDDSKDVFFLSILHTICYFEIFRYCIFLRLLTYVKDKKTINFMCTVHTSECNIAPINKNLPIIVICQKIEKFLVISRILFSHIFLRTFVTEILWHSFYALLEFNMLAKIRFHIVWLKT